MNTADSTQFVVVRGALQLTVLAEEGVTVTVIVYGPGVALVLTTKWPVITLPLLTVHAGAVTGVPETEHVGWNDPPGHGPAPQASCPLIPTVEPLPPVPGRSAIVLVGVPLITKFACAESPVLPVTVTV